MSIQEYNEIYIERINWLSAKVAELRSSMLTKNNVCACDGLATCGAHAAAYNELQQAFVHLQLATIRMADANRG